MGGKLTRHRARITTPTGGGSAKSQYGTSMDRGLEVHGVESGRNSKVLPVPCSGMRVMHHARAGRDWPSKHGQISHGGAPVFYLIVHVLTEQGLLRRG